MSEQALLASPASDRHRGCEPRPEIRSHPDPAPHLRCICVIGVYLRPLVYLRPMVEGR
jgi:hypothetical protein